MTPSRRSLRAELASTYSIVAFDAASNTLGVGVQTHQMTVGRLVPWVKPGVGAVATQSLVNVSYGADGLALMEQGQHPQDAIQRLTALDPQAYHRQVGMVDARGRAAAFTGDLCIAHAGHYVGDGFTMQANMMTHPTVIDAMRDAYERTSGDLAARIMAALYAAEAQGGDIRGKQSAALRIAPNNINRPMWDTLYDLRVDESPAPLDELARLVRLRRADLISDKGEEALFSGDKALALTLFAQARELAPELEELAFWQAIQLADGANDVPAAAAIFLPVFAQDPLRPRWIDLIQRLEAAQLIQRKGAAAELIAALGSLV